MSDLVTLDGKIVAMQILDLFFTSQNVNNRRELTDELILHLSRKFVTPIEDIRTFSLQILNYLSSGETFGQYTHTNFVKSVADNIINLVTPLDAVFEFESLYKLDVALDKSLPYIKELNMETFHNEKTINPIYENESYKDVLNKLSTVAGCILSALAPAFDTLPNNGEQNSSYVTGHVYALRSICENAKQYSNYTGTFDEPRLHDIQESVETSLNMLENIRSIGYRIGQLKTEFKKIVS